MKDQNPITADKEKFVDSWHCKELEHIRPKPISKTQIKISGFVAYVEMERGRPTPVSKTQIKIRGFVAYSLWVLRIV